MTTIGFIGSGNIGGTVARLAVKAGYDVVVSNSRGPETLADFVAELGGHARAANAAEDAAAAGDIVVVSIPLKNYEAVPVEPLAGKVVLDTNNYYPERDGQIPSLDAKEATTSGLLQTHLPASHVVKVFNNIFFKTLAAAGRPAGAADRTPLLIAGDDADAKKQATAFLDAIGYDAYDAGPLAESWRFEKDQPAYGGIYAASPADFATPRVPTVEEITTKLAEAVR